MASCSTSVDPRRRAVARATPVLRVAVVVLALAVSACSVTWRREHPLGCATGEQRLVRDALYFGQSRRDGRPIDDAQWQAFLGDVVTPAFPAGLTVLDGTGQWRGADGAIQHERSRVVILLHADDAASEHAIARIVADYRTRFDQEAVLRERGAACVTF